MVVIALLVASRGPHCICLPRVFLLGRCIRVEFHLLFIKRRSCVNSGDDDCHLKVTCCVCIHD